MEKVYIVMKNSDFTEGRGPMVLHSVWDDGEGAIAYVEKQQGIYGSKQKVEKDKYGYFAYANGYEIRETFVFPNGTDPDNVEKQKLKEKALAKLTKEERSILGLR